MTVSSQDRDEMTRLLNIIEGKETSSPVKNLPSSSAGSVELAGPGAITQADINAMAGILSKLNSVDTRTTIVENVDDRLFNEALETSRTDDGVKVGKYKIQIQENKKRLAGKQYYSIYHSITNETIADDLSLYETALAAVRLLNNGKFVNSKEVRKLFEQDDIYTSHRVDALRYKYRLSKSKDPMKQDIYESRYQASLDRAMLAKQQIKNLSNER